jgi:hypothetical protein
MNSGNSYTRIAGVSLLGTLAAIIATINKFPGYDARPAYFAQYLPTLINQRDAWAFGLVTLTLTGILTFLVGISLILAFSRSGRSNPVTGSIFIISSMGFFLSSVLGLQALRIIESATKLPVKERFQLAGEVFPWASGSQTVLLMFGLGLFSIGLLVTITALLQTGAFSRRLITVALAIPIILWLVIALTIEGAPLVWLVPGLPLAIWSVGLGLFLVFSGRLTSLAPVSTA